MIYLIGAYKLFKKIKAHLSRYWNSLSNISKIEKFQDSKILKFQNFKILRYLDAKIVELWNLKIQRHRDSKISRSGKFNNGRRS